MKYLAIVAALLLVWGCGNKKTVDDGQGGSVTVENSGDKTKVTHDTDKGKSTVETNQSGDTKYSTVNDKGEKSTAELSKSFDPKDLTIPIYPGAQVSKEKGSSLKLDTPEKSTVTCTLTTPDKPEKVTDFYKKELKNPEVISSDNMSVINGKSAAGEDVAINAMVNKDKHITEIIISIIKNKKK